MPSLRNANVTTRGCPVCGGPFPAGRARRWCCDACRQAAYRARHAPAVTARPSLRGCPRRPRTVYACPQCDTRLLGVQRCPDCATFMTRVGPGGICPCCSEPQEVHPATVGAGERQPDEVALADGQLVAEADDLEPSPRQDPALPAQERFDVRSWQRLLLHGCGRRLVTGVAFRPEYWLTTLP